MKHFITNNFLQNKTINKQKGYVALMTVLVLSTVIVTLSIGMQISTRNTISSADVLRDYLQSQYSVDACAEIALQHVRDTDETNGSGAETINNSDCIYTVTSNGPQGFDMNITASKNNTHYGVNVAADALFPAINITSWDPE